MKRKINSKSGREQMACAVMLLLGWTAYSAAAAESNEIANAKLVAASWLELIDKGAYGEAWQRASGNIRKRVGGYITGGESRDSEKQNWTEWMRERRAGLVHVLRRTTVYAGPLRNPRDERHGKFLEIEYDTDFDSDFGGKRSHIFEYVEMLKGKSNSWTVCWYFIRQKSPTELRKLIKFKIEAG